MALSGALRTRQINVSSVVISAGISASLISSAWFRNENFLARREHAVGGQAVGLADLRGGDLHARIAIRRRDVRYGVALDHGIKEAVLLFRRGRRVVRGARVRRRREAR